MSRLAALSILLIAWLTAPAIADDSRPADESPTEELGYAIGHQVGSDFRRSGTPLDPDALLAGLRDALEGTPPRWSAAEMKDALRRLDAEQRGGEAGSR